MYDYYPTRMLDLVTSRQLDSLASGKQLYRRITRAKRLYLLLGAVSLAIVLIIDVLVGPSGLPHRQVVSAIALPSAADAPTWAIVWLIRLPAATMALVVGASLGIAGAEMQTILANPLASPYTLGVAAASGFGAALGLVLGVGLLPLATGFLVPVNAFIFALLCSFSVYAVSRLRRASVESLVLTGIAFHFLFSALLALLQYMATQEQLQAIVFWLFGSLSKATWTGVAIVGSTLLVTLPIFARDAWMLTALRLGDAKAESLGIDVRRLRRRVLVLTSILAAMATCFVGTIGFIGLAAPHIARMLVGEDQRFFMPLSALNGALVLTVASIVSKALVPGIVFPIGIITSFVGIPFFLSLVLIRRSRYW